MLAYIHPLGGGLPDTPDNSLPGIKPPGGNTTLPVLPGIWPPPGTPNLPVDLPPHVENPIVIPGDPENPIALPPGIYPPLPPSTTGKYAILVWVLGIGHRWLVVDAGQIDNTLPTPPTAQPK